ncbi:hypothetical protein [Aliterella atlantica]|uniref:Uncharacterized protein n=1 Tax=Aliterella atlantica CENA595 TaxID=1618023 RepID=A0A0D8ZNX5_9CYAN|nr:hypothetical protein [Aliterella atlantica]KJH70057.1 hypothetical protein UH38_20090 [Aliterella atlantica CENA595]
MLRGKVQKLIEQSQDAEEAAKLICIMLDESLDLSANGWFDEDPELEALFGDAEREIDYVQLSDKIDRLLAATSTSD